RRVEERGGDQALTTLLGFLSVDEQAHHNFFLKAVQLFLKHDRAATLMQLRRVLHRFAMPAVYEMVDGAERVAAIKALRVFDDEMYFRDVYQPILASLGVGRPELRRCSSLPPLRVLDGVEAPDRSWRAAAGWRRKL